MDKDMSDVDNSVTEPQDTTSSVENNVSENGVATELEKEENAELTKDNKDKENYESKEEEITQTETKPTLKYTYSNEQWSPINTSGKKVYDRDFLMELKNDSNSKIKPANLPDLDVIIDASKKHISVDPKPKELNLKRYDKLFPGFARDSLTAHVPMPTRTFSPAKPMNRNRSNVGMIHMSLGSDVKLRESENAWKPRRLDQKPVSEEQSKTEVLYKKVRSVLNKLTPQKFDTLVNQVRELEIDTEERLQGVIDLVFKKAVDEPNFSVAYALMCKELSAMQVKNSESKDSSTATANFRRLLLMRCQSEFEKNTVDEKAHIEKLKEIEECSDPEKKKELQMTLNEEERVMRMRSVGNIRFIGELFKQNMLTCKIMHQCIRHLLKQQDEENLECLCKLLSTIGKVLEAKNVDLSEYFKQMQKIVKSGKGKVSSRIRFMLQDVIDLRTNKWVPRRDDSNPKTIDQIQKEAELEQLNILLNNASISSPSRKDNRVNDRSRNRR